MKLIQILRCRINQTNYIILLLVVVVIIAALCYLNPDFVNLLNGCNEEQKSSICNKRSLRLTERTFTIRQELVRDLVIATKAFQAAQTSNTPPSNKSIRALWRILTQINPEYVNDKILNENETLKPVCPELFTNRTLGIPFFENEKGWITQPCMPPPIEKIVSIVLNPLDDDNNYQHLQWILKGINKTYPFVAVYIATKTFFGKQTKSYSNVRRVLIPSRQSSGNTWAKLISKVTTPYVLVARNLFHFTNFTRLERLISIVSKSKLIPVAGGATRNLTGHWNVGCFQTQMRNYILEYIEGYHVSKNECMFCNYLAGPFIARTDIFKEIPLNPSLSKEMLFHDFFLELRKANYLVANCPDSMYFSNIHRAANFNKESWIQLANKWQLNRILLPKGVKHVFSCEESSLNCNRSITKAYLLPLCCREEYLQFIKKTVNVGFRYELRHGDVLAAVKMRGSIPWDTDTDLYAKLTDKHLWKNAWKELEHAGFKSIDYGDLLKVQAPDTYIMMDLIHELSSKFLPDELKDFPTLAEYDGEWLTGPASPGLYARNAYGYDILKHSQSYDYYGLDQYALYNPSYFLPCPDPDHHSCINHFSVDGNIQFMAP